MPSCSLKIREKCPGGRTGVQKTSGKQSANVGGGKKGDQGSSRNKVQVSTSTTMTTTEDDDEEDEDEEIAVSDEDEQEDANDYVKGGYHPVKIGDVFENR